MEEYINREQAVMQLTGRFTEDTPLEEYVGLVNSRLNNLPKADVIERSKIDEVIKEMKDKSFKHYFQFGEYIDEDVRQLEVIELKDVLEIFKRNIGE